MLEEKLFAMLLASTPDEEIVMVRAAADRDLAPYRRKMSAAQIDQLQKQYVHKRLLEKYRFAAAEFVLHVTAFDPFLRCTDSRRWRGGTDVRH